MLLLFFLSSGLFLGWSLGANDASNIFGSAVSTKMVKFRTAAIIASIFVILGAVVSGSGTSQTLGQLGSVNMIAGAFIVALAAGLTLFLMTKLGIPVSASQAIVGAIIGWNFFSGTLTNWGTLINIFSAWISGPVIAAIISFIFYKALTAFTHRINIHLFRLDAYTRAGLLVVGAFGAYSLGANNIANVMGVFVPVAPFKAISLYGLGELSSTHQLFLLGGIAIAVGIFTYSQRVMRTVGKDIVHLTPQAAFVVVLAESVVLFLFASRGLHDWLTAHGLPAFPLVPISSSQAVIGAVIGIGLTHGGRNIRFRTLRKIALGWILTPLLATVMTFVALFFLQNVFDQKVYYPIHYQVTETVAERLWQEDIQPDRNLTLRSYNARQFQKLLSTDGRYDAVTQAQIFRYAELYRIRIENSGYFGERVKNWFSPLQLEILAGLEGEEFQFKWRLEERLSATGIEWQADQLEYIYSYFRVEE
ncbi:MAG: inorganic phosphate transporter [Candidatus Neomarinimicrobiota bacterium]